MPGYLARYFKKHILHIPPLTLALVLSACGGGGGGTPPPVDPPGTSQPPSGPVPTPAASAISSLKSGVFSFETAPTRPIAISSDKQRLFVTNTPDSRLEIYQIDSDGMLSPSGSIPVGLDPVALAVHNNGNEVWVVNHLSDSISIVDVSTNTPTIKRTLLVGDEPRDIVFAQGKAFITAAHRGQHRQHSSISGAFDDLNGDPEISSASKGRADIWVFDDDNLGDSLGGTPLKVLELFGDTTRGLAVSPDGNTVYAAVFNSGNQTSVVHESVMCRGFEDSPSGVSGTGEARNGNQPCIAGNIPAGDAESSPNGPGDKTLPKSRPLPSQNVDGENQPWTGMIVKYDNASNEWRDSRDLNYSNGIRFTLPDHDVFAIDANSLTQSNDFEHVGTTLFNIATNPVSGKVYVSNTDAQNHIRFEGPGVVGGSTVQGNIARSQITIIDPLSSAVKPRHLNRHIDYNQLKAPTTVKEHTVSTPTEMQVSADGSKLFVAALGSNKVAVYQTADLEDDSLWDNTGLEFDPSQVSGNHFSVAGGPQGLLLDSSHNGSNGQLYVLTRYDNQIKVIDAANGSERQTLSMYNPEPDSFQAGRFMLYDADRTSSNGESSCGSCHVFGDMDHLAWNLGNPDGSNGSNTNPFPIENILNLGCDFVGPADPSCLLTTIINGNGETRDFASMKGPMTTQTMRGMSTHGHLHWRGDRVGGYFGTEVDDNADGDNNPDTRDMEALDERLSFKNFIVAFEGLLGMNIDLDGGVNNQAKTAEVLQLETDIDNFADFMLQVQLPPNPIRQLDNSLSASAQTGKDFFEGSRRSDGLEFDDNANGPEQDGMNCEGCHTHDAQKGFYGTDGKVGSGGEILILKVPHFRNLYQKVGMFGLANREGFLPSNTDTHQGDQIRGFGFLHDGATDTLFNFLSGGVFDNGETTCAQTRGGVPNWAGCDFNDGQSVGIPDDTVRQGVVDYMMEFESDIAPIVGQQMTLFNGANSDMLDRVALLESRASSRFTSKVLGGEVYECELLASGTIDGIHKAFLFDPADNSYRSDQRSEATTTADDLRELAQQTGNRLTYTCVVPGTGYRIALDRDVDGILNRDET